MDENCVSLATMPMFHVTGMQAVMNGPVYAGGTVVIMTRWDRRIAAELIQRYGVTRWRSIAAMAIDFANMPDLERYDLSSLARDRRRRRRHARTRCPSAKNHHRT
jgi:fatty-acyl-CoA synthase